MTTDKNDVFIKLLFSGGTEFSGGGGEIKIW